MLWKARAYLTIGKLKSRGEITREQREKEERIQANKARNRTYREIKRVGKWSTKRVVHKR